MDCGNSDWSGQYLTIPQMVSAITHTRFAHRFGERNCQRLDCHFFLLAIDPQMPWKKDKERCVQVVTFFYPQKEDFSQVSSGYREASIAGEENSRRNLKADIQKKVYGFLDIVLCLEGGT